MKPPRVKRPVPARPPGFSPEWAGGPSRTRRAVPAWGSSLPAPHPVASPEGQELDTLRDRLKAFEGAKPAVQLDPAQVRPSGWSNRHDSAYTSPAFQRLKDNLDLAGGNEQPILVRRVDAGYPTLLHDVPTPTLRAYPKVTVVAEKPHTATILGM